MSIDRRKQDRLDVANFVDLKIQIEGKSSPLQFLTMSEGGCGVGTTDVELQFRTGEWVRCAIEYRGEKCSEVVCEVLYSHPHNFSGEFGKFIGLRFSRESVERLATIYSAIHEQVIAERQRNVI